jgi:hypothetical protein
MNQVNKYVVFKNTFEPDTKLLYFQTREEAMSFKVNSEQHESNGSWTIATVDPHTPSWLRKMWLWLESKMRCYE